MAKLGLSRLVTQLPGAFRIPQELADPIRDTPTGTTILLTLDDLADLGGYVAAEANHTTDKKVRKKLDAIFSKIQDLLESNADEELHKSLKFKNAKRPTPIGDKVVEMAEWAAKRLIGAEQLGIKDKPVARFPLPPRRNWRF
jgi:hypothetical protein